jgi:hypothetical protein
MGLSLLLLSAASGARAFAVPAPSPTDPEALAFFEKKIRPLLVDNCYTCHSANTNAKGELRVDDRNGLLTGGTKGAAIVPGDPEKSLLLKAVKQVGELKMPPKKHLTDQQIADLTTWIKNGAAWPVAQFTLAKPSPRYEQLRKEFWAWQPLHDAAPPTVSDPAWAGDDIDRYVLAKLQEKGLKPAPDAGKLALIRRVTFDLTGLPPTPQEIDAFVNDSSSGAFEMVVDRLLASKAFGERWGRHWLDVARYGESTGSSRNLPYPEAWRYRDYVIDAFNKDKPYDQFICEQIAGDLLPAKNDAERDEHLIATGFLALGVKDVNQRFKVRYIMDNVDEQIDTVSRSVLALTVSCARCHDHKFDPIPTSDYYALAGIFRSSDICAGLRNKMGGGGMDYYDKSMLLSLAGEKPASAGAKAAPAKIDPKIVQLKKDFEQAKKEWFAIRNTKEGLTKGPNGQNKQRPYRLKFEKLQRELEAAGIGDDAGPSPASIILGERDDKQVADTQVRIRGEAEKLGPVVPRGFLSVVEYPDEPKINPKHSGRLELAQWLTSPKNPLTSRVIVNRIWGHLFGEGLVKSVDNFGTKGDVPSHPELLDDLARRFVSEGWSTKKLVREIVLSHAYRLSADEVPANMAADPANRFIWRHSPRRLEAEEIRDAALAVAGKLDSARPQGSPAQSLKVRELANNGPEAAHIAELAQADTHRSVYLPLLRGLTPTSLEVFDFAEQGMVTGHRDATTVATQALYLLNDPFVRRQSLTLAERLLAQNRDDDANRIDLAYRLAFGRPASAEEIARATRFLSDFENADRQVVAASPGAKPAPVLIARANADAAEPANAVAVATRAEDGQDSDSDKKPDAFAAGAGTAQKAKEPVNPDEIIHEEHAPKVDVVRPAGPKQAAWTAFCQALLGSAEFRYLK